MEIYRQPFAKRLDEKAIISTFERMAVTSPVWGARLPWAHAR
jgi:hypothetical protein